MNLIINDRMTGFVFAQTENKIAHSKFTKVTDFLYEVTYTDYDPEFLNVEREGIIASAGGFLFTLSYFSGKRVLL